MHQPGLVSGDGELDAISGVEFREQALQHGRQTDRGRIFARVAGQGPPLLLLHGYPQMHVMWHTVADLLTNRFTVVVADLPGYGASFRPVRAADIRPN